jgi:hypothetical protein
MDVCHKNPRRRIRGNGNCRLSDIWDISNSSIRKGKKLEYVGRIVSYRTSQYQVEQFVLHITIYKYDKLCKICIPAAGVGEGCLKKYL